MNRSESLASVVVAEPQNLAQVVSQKRKTAQAISYFKEQPRPIYPDSADSPATSVALLLLHFVSGADFARVL